MTISLIIVTILLLSVLVGALVFISNALPKLGIRLSSLIPGSAGATSQTEQTQSSSIVGTTLRKSRDPDYYKHTYLKGVMFVLFPLYINLLFGYQVDWVIERLGGWILPYSIWLVIGMVGYTLVPYCSFKDDGGRKTLNFGYKASFVVFLVALAVWARTGENHLRINEEYEKAALSVVVAEQTQSRVVAKGSDRLQPTNLTEWREVTGFTQDRQFVISVSAGDTVCVRNLAQTNWTAGLQIFNGRESKMLFNADSGDLQIPIAIGGELFFQLPRKGKVEFIVV